MAVISFPISLTACLLFICLLNKIVAILMIQNILGLPNYVIGEILSTAGEHVIGGGGGSSSGSHRTISSNHRGGSPMMMTSLRIGKDTPGLTSLLTFDLQEKHLSKTCRRKHSSTTASQQQSTSTTTTNLLEPQFSVQKQFTLVNYGKNTVRVRGFLIGPHVGVSSSSYKSKSTIASLNDQPIGSNQLLSQLIGYVYCQGFGFKVLNCDLNTNNHRGINSTEPMFELAPNESKKISIAFTPDFTIAKTLATLTVVTDDGPFDGNAGKPWTQVLKEQLLEKSWLSTLIGGSKKPTSSNNEQQPSPKNNKVDDGTNKKQLVNMITYSLVATVPKTLLSSCDESLPRPYQEMIMYYTLVVFMVCLVMVTVACAFIDGTRVLNFTFYPAIMMTRPATTVDGFHSESFKPFSLNGETTTSRTVTVMSPSKTTHSSSSETSNTTNSMNMNNSRLNNNKNRVKKNQTQDSSWASYLKSKLVTGCPTRRGSNGSNTSSISDGKVGVGGGGGGLGNSKNLASIGDSKGKKGKKEATAAAIRRKLNAKSWFESLSTRRDEKKEEEEPLPLPSFDNTFDDQDIQYLTGTKKGKRHLTTDSSSATAKTDKKGEKSSTATTTTKESPTAAKVEEKKADKTTSTTSTSTSTEVHEKPIAKIVPNGTSTTSSISESLVERSPIGVHPPMSMSPPLKPFIHNLKNLEPSPEFVSSLLANEIALHPIGRTSSISSTNDRTKLSSRNFFTDTLSNHSFSDNLISPFTTVDNSMPTTTTEFGYWNDGSSSTSNRGSHHSPRSIGGDSGGGGQTNNLIWDSPITMFEPEQAMRELQQQRQQQRSQSLSSKQQTTPTPSMLKNGSTSKSGLCPVGPPPGLVRSESVSEAERSTLRNSSFPPIGTFQLSDVFRGQDRIIQAADVTRPPTTPSPHRWSPSHKAVLSGTPGGLLESDSQTLFGSTTNHNWSIGQSGMDSKWNSAIQRPRDSGGNKHWEEAGVSEATESTWQKPCGSSWNSLAPSASEASATTGQTQSPTSSFSLFGGQTPWSPLSGTSVGSLWPFSSSKDDSTGKK